MDCTAIRLWGEVLLDGFLGFRGVGCKAGEAGEVDPDEDEESGTGTSACCSPESSPVLLVAVGVLFLIKSKLRRSLGFWDIVVVLLKRLGFVASPNVCCGWKAALWQHGTSH